jgi:hypothetical protein
MIGPVSGKIAPGKNALRFIAASILMAAAAQAAHAQAIPKFKVLAFFTTASDPGHISYEHEANGWFPKIAKQYNFQYDSTRNWSDCNAANLAKYQVVIFLDTRPEETAQRDAFKQYMDNGGGWIGCHYAAFAMNVSGVKQNWDWYHKTFLGSGEYKSNTWRPTSAILKVEDTAHVFTKGLPVTFKASPNEWYRWQIGDWKTLKDIKILLSIDPSSYPLGTKAETNEIWTSGYYPVVWTNVKYRMLYLNMGHNDLNSPEAGGKDSRTFDNDTQNKLIINALLYFGGATTGITSVTGAKAENSRAEIRRNGSTLSITAPADKGFDAQTFDMLGQKLESPDKAHIRAGGAELRKSRDPQE